MYNVPALTKDEETDSEPEVVTPVATTISLPPVEADTDRAAFLEAVTPRIASSSNWADDEDELEDAPIQFPEWNTTKPAAEPAAEEPAAEVTVEVTVEETAVEAPLTTTTTSSPATTNWADEDFDDNVVVDFPIAWTSTPVIETAPTAVSSPPVAPTITWADEEFDDDVVVDFPAEWAPAEVEPAVSEFMADRAASETSCESECGSETESIYSTSTTTTIGWAEVADDEEIVFPADWYHPPFVNKAWAVSTAAAACVAA